MKAQRMSKEMWRVSAHTERGWDVRFVLVRGSQVCCSCNHPAACSADCAHTAAVKADLGR